MMPGLAMDEVVEDKVFDEMPEKENSAKNENLELTKSPNDVGSVVHVNPGDAGASGAVVEPSIEELYDNVCDMQSTDQSVSRLSYGSDGEESRIDSELRHLVGGEMKEVEILKENEEGVKQNEEESLKSNSLKSSKKASQSRLESEASSISSPKSKTHKTNSLLAKKMNKKSRKPVVGEGTSNETDKDSDRGPYLLKQARDLMSSGSNPRKALDLALQAASCFKKSSNGKPNLDIVMCLHVTAAIYCSLGQYNEAIPVLEESIEIPVVNESQDHALAKFSGLMQLGDTYSMLGQLENSLKCYTVGLEVQREVLGDSDPRIGETCRYLSEAYVQALDFNEAERFCKMAIEIHVKNGLQAEEAADRRLMGLIYESKGDHEGALEHLVLASMTMVAIGQESEVSFVDLSIGDTYLSLSKYDEAIFAYQKALTSLKSSKGENHPSVASVYARLADLCNKTGKFKESKSYCENALRIYENRVSGIPLEEIACGFTNISALYESMDEIDQALELLHKALKIYNDVPGQQSTIAGIEAQMGVMYYVLGKYSESYDSFRNAISKLRVSSEKKSGFYGIALNQMGLACVQRYAINEAIECFEEARTVLEHECGAFHPDTLAVYSNLAGTYDAVGRLDDAIKILEHIVEAREEKLGTAGFDVEDEKKRLAELLKEAGKVRSRKARSLETLFDSNDQSKTSNEVIEV
ncbi:putative tetratricopeptide-like helical domain superfamily, malT-like TPR region [Helianthus annuus]|nr:putative tetratricopeptide-like helical domain superfamily, malT-like TPR region [Helianthus annuus]KAJ0578316.1 putative tetratricopeptide-like helical domain superfamily, malT-like TPR region [Helianthus annuus]KAJ0748192.1 putative tetratricopeptide-like helical domain superfamily, malT-like TPR region [Helianthus annuus]